MHTGAHPAKSTGVRQKSGDDRQHPPVRLPGESIAVSSRLSLVRCHDGVEATHQLVVWCMHPSDYHAQVNIASCPRTRAFAIFGSLLSLLLSACSDVTVQPAPVDWRGLDGRAGVYGIQPSSSATTARTMGIDFAVSGARAGSSNDLPRLNPSMKDLLYRSFCPNGPTTCHAIGRLQEKDLLAKVTNIARSDARDPNVIGTYLLDDHWANMQAVLPRIYNAIRTAGNNKPVVCGVAATLTTTKDTSFRDSQLTRSLINYSSRWCDAAMVYVYRPKGTDPPSASFDWSMTLPLKNAIQGLKDRGFRWEKNMLIGTPQAFAYMPRTRNWSGPIQPQFWAGPSGQQLTKQITSFCAAGARAIIGYTWDDGSRGSVAMLGTSAPMRKAFTNGVRACEKTYWPRQKA